MRGSISLERSLFRRQQLRIQGFVQKASPQFQRYQARYRRATRDFRRVLNAEQVEKAVRGSDVVYVGDYHTLRLAQAGFVELLKSAIATGRRVVVGLELVEGRHQPTLDRFMAGKVSAKKFLELIGHPYRGAFDVWPNFAPVLELSREKKLEVVAIDRRASGSRRLQVRDAFAAEKISKVARAEDRPLVLVLMGQYHVTPSHLPRQVRKRLGPVERRHLVVYQNAEGVYWKLAQRGLADRARAVEVRKGELCLVSTSPVVCQQSFLDYVEAEVGDLPIEDRGVAGTFRSLALMLGSLLSIEVGEALNGLEVVTPGDVGKRLLPLLRRGGFSASELEQIEKHVLSCESAYVPRARLAYLASLSLNHAAEEAAHFVRHVCVGDAMDALRPRAQAFYARCMEEALGFFGSRLINSARRCVQLNEWQQTFTSGPAESRRTAAFVLALKAAEREGPEGCAPLLPLDDEPLFHAVSHALGYLLGDALFRAWTAGRLDKLELQALFRDPLRHADERYFAWIERLTPAKSA